MERYRLDNLIEYILTSRGRENVALSLIAAGGVVGMVVIARL
jgi:hypothetical protein